MIKYDGNIEKKFEDVDKEIIQLKRRLTILEKAEKTKTASKTAKKSSFGSSE